MAFRRSVDPEREVTEVPLKTESLRHHWEFYSVPPPFLAWSSNGQRLLSLEQSAPQGAASIVRVSLQTGAKRILTSPPKEMNGDGGLGVSPDGKRWRLLERWVCSRKASMQSHSRKMPHP